MFAVLSWLAGVGLGWLTALAGSVKIINWLTVPTAVANLVNFVGSLFMPVNFYAVLDVARIVGIAIIAISLPLLWWRFRHTDREALTGIAWAMVIVVLFVPAALPWYYTWPLAVLSALAQSRQAIAAIAGFSTWIMVIFKPDGSARHVLVASCAAGDGLCRGGLVLAVQDAGTAAAHHRGRRSGRAGRQQSVTPSPGRINMPSPGRAAPPRGPGASAARRPDGRCPAVPSTRRA